MGDEHPPGSGFELLRDPEVLRALAHPTRMRIFVAAVAEPLSAKELAERFEQPVARVSYHVRALAAAGLVRPVRRTRRRGAIETHYRATATPDISDEVLAKADPGLVAVFAQAMIRDIADDALDAVDRGAATASDFMLARAHFRVTEEGRRRLFSELLAIYDRLRELEAELRAEADAAPGGAQELNLTLGFYEGEKRAERNGPFVMVPTPEGGPVPVQIPPREPPRG